MTPSHSEEHRELSRVVRRFLEEHSSSQDVRRLIEEGGHLDPDVWARMADQLGLQGIAIPEEYGGSGFGPVELGLVLEEMGRVLLVAPYVSSVVLAAQTLTASGDAAAQESWLPGIATGGMTATLAIAEESGGWDVDQLRVNARQAEGEWLIDGTKHFVLDGGTADLVLVVARIDTGADGNLAQGASETGVFAIGPGAPGLVREQMEGLDLTRPLASLVFESVPAVRIAPQVDAATWLPRLFDLIRTAIAAELVGGASRCLEMSVDYAKTREQFGRAIGSFQAIKHKCAQLLLEIESGRSAVAHAAAAMDEPAPEPSIAASVAFAHGAQTFTHAAKECIQIHGGIGYTWEHDAHLFLRRAKSDELLFGGAAGQRRRLADLVGI